VQYLNQLTHSGEQFLSLHHKQILRKAGFVL